MSPQRPKVLIVDDEDNIVLALHRVLYQDNHRYDVLLARSAEIAQQIVADTRIDVLVTDVRLPEKSGMDLLGWVAVQAPTTRVIMMTAFDVGGIKDRAHAFGCLRLVRKPFDVHEMRAAILHALSLRESFAGDLSELSCVDVIQMLCIARKSTALRLSESEQTGVIHIEQGELVHAVWGDVVGEEAFFRMLAVKQGLFQTGVLPPEIERTIHGDWQYLLMEGMRRLDEATAPGGTDRSVGGQERHVVRPGEPSSSPRSLRLDSVQAVDSVPPSTQSARSEASSSGPDISQLLEEGFNALRAGRKEDARRAWEDALRIEPHNRILALNVRKLGGTVPPKGASGGAS